VARKNPAAVQLGRRGGKARVANMSKDELKAANRKAAEARWAKTRALVDDITERSKRLEEVAVKRAAKPRAEKHGAR
jgi:hypothetical protein